MSSRIVIWILVCLGLLGRVRAQEEQAFERVRLRVTSTPAGSMVVVDRGSNDFVELGDLVVFRPREGGAFEGSVVQVDRRRAVVELLDKSVNLAVGTPGVAFIPAARFEPAPAAGEAGPPEAGEDPEGAGQAATQGGEPSGHSAWENSDEGWSQEMPLLAEIRAVRPERRDPLITGRLYMIADTTHASLDDRSDAFLRFGQSLRMENPFQRGGGLQIDMEQNYRATDLADQPDEDTGRLRFDRLSYYEGGGRFSNRRWEAGRFLQHGVPEFGLLDGFEYTHRLENGHSVGGSIGFMPEPFDHLNSGRDFQVSGYYRWVADASERLTATGGFQQTLHNGASDRSLLLGKVQYLPQQGWNFNGSVWLDFYSGSDAVKDSSLGITQLHLSTARNWEGKSGARVAFNHWEFPELQRNEGFRVQPEQLADAHNNRLSFSGWKQINASQRTHAELGVWSDQEESGGDAAAGVTFTDLFGDRSRTDVTLFGTKGRFSTLIGARVLYGRFVKSGRWDLFYEIAQNDQEGFDADQDNFTQHRLRASRSLSWLGAWDLSAYAEGVKWADEDSWSLGLYLQRSF